MAVLLLIFFLISSLSASFSAPPKIQLAIKEGSYTLAEGDNLSVLCFGESEVEWRFPLRHMNCYGNVSGPIDIHKRLNFTQEMWNVSHSHYGPSHYVSSVTLLNASYLDTGFVECFYKSSGPKDVVNVDQFYLFVNSSEHLLMPCSPPQDSCKLPADTRRKSVPIFLDNYGDFAPCKPTSPKLSLEVRAKSSKAALLSFVDPFRGFQLLNTSDTTTYVECFVTGHENGDKCAMHLNYASPDPMCSLKVSPTEDSRLILSNSDVTIQCEALCAWIPISYFMDIEPAHGLMLKSLPHDRFGSFYRVRSELMMKNVSKEQSGMYSCNFTVVSSQMATFALIVQDPTIPSFLVPNPTIQHFVFPTDLNKTRTITLDCLAFGTPTPEYRWFNGSSENDDNLEGWDRLVLTAGFDVVGNYTCTASNSQGSISRTFRISVFEQEKEYTTEVIYGEPRITAWIIGIVAAVCFGVIAALLSLGMFGYIRLRRRSRNVRLKTMWRQYFSTMDGFQFREMSSTSGESPPTLNTFVSNSSASMNQRPDIWLSDHLDQLPYNEFYELDLSQLDFKEMIGRGAFGVVYRAELRLTADSGDPPSVAVKCIKDSFDLEQYAALCSEIKLLSMLGPNLNVCSLIGAVTRTLEDGLLCMVLEYCEGGNLKRFLSVNREVFESTDSFDYFSLNYSGIGRAVSVANASETDYLRPSVGTGGSSHGLIASADQNGAISGGSREVFNEQTVIATSTQNNTGQTLISEPIAFDLGSVRRERLSARDLAVFAYQIASGMEFLHDRHCLHRDLAARNILVCSGNVLKISDFGLAKDIYKYGGEYRKKTNGKVPFKWLAPECIRYKIYNKETDIWAFGVLLWEIFTLGKDPYPDVSSFDESFLELLERDFRLPRPDFADDHIAGLINNCWHKVNKSRPSIALVRQELRRRLPAATVEHYDRLSDQYLALNTTRTQRQRSNNNSNNSHNLACLAAIPEATRQIATSPIYYRNGAEEVRIGATQSFTENRNEIQACPV